MHNDKSDNLVTRARALPRSMKPPHELWSGIEREINAPSAEPENPQRDLKKPMPLAMAAVLVLGVLGIATTAGYLAAGVFPRENPAVSATVVSRAAPYDARFGIHYAMGPAFVQARSDLVSDLDRELSRLSPQSQRSVMESLKKIENAILEINRALKKEPNNELLQKLLLSTYSEELQMLGDMDGMTRTLSERTRI